MVIWDKIIERAEDAKLVMDKATVEYGLIDQGADLRNTTIQLRLVWDHMPLTGIQSLFNCFLFFDRDYCHVCYMYCFFNA